MDWKPLLDFALIQEAIVKLVLAALLAGLVGSEREAHGQAAGFRTYMLIGLGSCLMMMVSLHMETIHRHLTVDSTVRVDPGRIASYALAGMGFLGAGAIISGRGTVRGLTTAAGMWMITGVGLAVGSGYYIPAILATLLSLFTLYALRRTKAIFHRDVFNTIIMVSDDVGGQLGRIEHIVQKYRFSRIQFVSFRRNLEKGLITFRVQLVGKEDMEWRDLTSDLTKLPGVREIALEEGEVP